MRSRIRSRLTFSNVIALTALFVSLAGGSYAAIQSVKSGDIKNRTIKAADVKKNALGGDEIKESDLDKVPKSQKSESAKNAENAQSLDGASLESLKLKCPEDTDPHAGVCFEELNRVLVVGHPFIEAARECGTDQRRLPTATELSSYLLEPGVEHDRSELTEDLWIDGRDSTMHALRVFDPAGASEALAVGTVQVGSNLAKEIGATFIYRCVAYASN